MHHFGLGYLAAIPSGANPTPIPFALLRDVSLDISVKLVKERGQWQHVIAVGRGEVDITGKADSASIFGGAVGHILGVTPSTGSTVGVPGETGTVPAVSGPYTITVANSASFAADHGVLDLTSGLYLSRVASAPATGQYSVAAGVYTFAAADTLHRVSISYSYTAAAVGKTVAVSNAVMALASGVQLVAYGPARSGGHVLGVKLYSAHFPKLALALKPSDFTVQSLEFFASQDSASTSIMDVYTGE